MACNNTVHYADILPYTNTQTHLCSYLPHTYAWYKHSLALIKNLTAENSWIRSTTHCMLAFTYACVWIIINVADEPDKYSSLKLITKGNQPINRRQQCDWVGEHIFEKLRIRRGIRTCPGIKQTDASTQHHNINGFSYIFNSKNRK